MGSFIPLLCLLSEDQGLTQLLHTGISRVFVVKQKQTEVNLPKHHKLDRGSSVLNSEPPALCSVQPQFHCLITEDVTRAPVPLKVLSSVKATCPKEEITPADRLL